MIIIPDRLFTDPNVKTIMRSGRNTILSKNLKSDLKNRKAFISQYAISVVEEGSQIIEDSEGNLIKVRPGEILVLRKGVYYVTDLLAKESGFSSYLVYFNDQILHEFVSDFVEKEPKTISNLKDSSFLKIKSDKSHLDYFRHIHTVYSKSEIKNSKVVRLKILEFLYLISRKKPRVLENFLFKLSLPKKQNIKNFMKNNFDKPLKVEDYAYLTGRSSSTFRRDFKRHFKITPKEWLRENRMNKAIEIIHTEKMSVTNLAFEVGYDNISYFIKSFKEKTGYSPKQYMKNIKMSNVL